MGTTFCNESKDNPSKKEKNHKVPQITKKKQEKGPDMTALHNEYQPVFEQCKSNHNFFTEHFSQVPQFASNLGHYFPKAKQNFDAFFEMAMYLRRDDKSFTINEHAAVTGPTTNILDRFFIIALKISHEDYDLKHVSIDELDEILMEYFRIFVREPEKGTATKILQFIGKESTQSINLKRFVDDLREAFPSAIRSLKDYYALKFKKLEKEAFLLKRFNSKIINNDSILLALRLNSLTSPDIKCLYNIDDYGLSFYTLEKQIVGYSGPWVLLVHHTEKNLEGEKENYIFGAYQNGPIRDVTNHQGDISGFIFTLHPKINFYTTDMGDGDNKYFWLNNISNQRFNKRKGLGFGGDADKKNFKLWIDQDIDKSTCYNGKDSTYGFGNLASYGTQTLNIRRMEIWGVGHKYNLQDQKKYWKERQEQIMRRRKVDKREFVQNNAGLFFQKTFEHRDQVVGEIQRRPNREERK